MKKWTVVLALILCQTVWGQHFGSVKTLADVDRAARELKEEIQNAPSRYSVTGTTYYVSQEGSDDNDGLSEKTPVKSLDKVNGLTLKRGDVVLFRRGDLWRGQIIAQPAVTYSAYGSGPKPRLYRSPMDAAKTGSWKETDKAGVYAFSERFQEDAGTLVFNEGEAGCAYKVLQKTDWQGNTFHMETGKPFVGYKDLDRDLDMYHDPADGTIYLCSFKGNPARRFHSIEILLHGHAVVVSWAGNAIDNLCIKYTGSHGIGASAKSLPFLKVTNCEIGWIGGSVQFDNPKPTKPGVFSRPTRYGNGVEIWGGCKSYVIDHNYVYQCYDAGITHQYSTKDAGINMDNITYSNNLIEKCVYAIEYFFSIPQEHLESCSMNNVLFKGNILRMTGTYSWGYQRPNKESPAAIKAWKTSCNRASNFRIENNIVDRGNPALLDVHADKPEWMPRCKGNIFVQQEGLPLGTEIEKNGRVVFVDENAPAKTRIILLGDSTCANSDVTVSSQRGWGQLFHLFFKPEEVQVVNHAVGGTSSKTFRQLPKYSKVKNEFGPGDIVTVQFGINDGSETLGRHTTETEFADTLKAFIADIRKGGARPVLLTPVVLRQFEWNAGLHTDENREMRARIIKEVGKEENVPVIDVLFLTQQWLSAKGDEGSKNYYCFFAAGAYPDGKYADGRKDNTHLNQAGAYEVALIISKKLVGLFPELKKQYVRAKYKDVVAEFGKIPFYTGN